MESVPTSLTDNDTGPWSVEQPVEPPVAVLVREPGTSTWRQAMLLAWRKHHHDRLEPWWAYVSFTDGDSDHFRQEWLRLAPGQRNS